MLKVLVVRHADIDLPRTSPDPPLNNAGRLRARALAHAATAAGVTAIFTSEFARTKQTAEPLAARLGLRPQEASGTLIGDLLGAPNGAVVLIVGHSNTIPEMIAALGVTPPMPRIEEPDFDNLFVVVTDPGTRQAALVHLKYGAEAG
jgi:broad specificity phosphatase PhoE